MKLGTTNLMWIEIHCLHLFLKQQRMIYMLFVHVTDKSTSTEGIQTMNPQFEY